MPGSRSQLRRWFARMRTLRFRLMGWNAAVVVLTAGATLVGVREGVRYALLHELDQILASDQNEIAIALEEPNGPTFQELLDELQRKARSHNRQGWFVQLLDDQQRLVWSSVPPSGAMAERLSDLQQPTSETPAKDLRMLERRVAARDVPVRRIRVGASLDFLQRELARIDRTAALTAGIALILAPLGGHFLAGRAIRPLAELIRVAARLRPDKLDERLPNRRAGDELDQLSRTINGLLDRIATHLKQRRDMLANSAHELRSPVAAIRSSAEVALQSGRTLDEYEELLSEIIDECDSLESLINQLLLLAETQAERLALSHVPVCWSDIVSSAVAMFEGAAEYADVQLVADIEPHLNVPGNKIHLRQVINNLLDNALKFTPAGKHVEVRLKRAAGRAVLEVADHGIGIAPEDVPRVFERFYRGDKSRCRETTRGTGLGLSICQAVAQAHQGIIQLESTPDQGTIVRVELPLVQQDTTAA